MKKKITAFCSGTRNGNTELFTRYALEAAESMGVECELIRLSECNLQPCKSCVKKVCMGLGPKACIIKDDAAWLFDKYQESDGIIFSSPVWCLSPNGVITDFRDRLLGPRSNEGTAQMDGGIPDWMESKGHPRVGALISVGGALTRNWTSLGLATLYTLTFPAGIRIVDQMDVYGVADPGEALMRKDYIRQAKLLGKNLAYAVLHPELDWTKEFWGETEEKEACPGCHTSLLVARPGTKEVECAICGRKGSVSMDENGLKYEWPEDPLDRLEDLGIINHVREIAYHTEEIYEPKLPEIQESYDELKKDKSFVVKPER